MDKRTIFFIFSFVAAMYLVNMFFESQRQENLHQWSQQQVAKKKEKIKELTEEAAQHTAKSTDLPIVEIYADNQAKDYLINGVRSGNAIITRLWTKNPPKKIFAKKSGSTDIQEFYLANILEEQPYVAVYQQKAQDLLKIGELPDFGKFDLQLVTIQKPSEVFLGVYEDGSLIILKEKISQLQREVEEQSPEPITVSDSIALLKTNDGYLPVAIYDQKEKNLIRLTDLSGLEGLISKPESKLAVTSDQKVEERFYVLETPYQQLVFSNHGGALAEINLPFQSETNPSSVVKEIEFDREMVEQHPYNARFPVHAYFTSGSDPSKDFLEHREGTLGGYYPLIRRDLVEVGKRKSIRVHPRFYSLNIISEYPETAELVYEVKSFTKNQIVFELTQNHRKITKTFSVDPENKAAPYCLDVTIKIEGDSRGLWLISGVPEVEWISGGPAPALKYRITRNQKAEVETIELPKDSITVTSIYPDWLCNSNGFFGLILDPLTEIDPGYRAQYVSGVAVPSRLVEIDEENNRFNPQNLPGYMMMLPLKHGGGSMNFRVFAGPFADSVLKAVDSKYANLAAGYNPDYIACQTFHGWFTFISEPFAKFLFILMNFFHQWTGSWGLSIILLTVALRLMLYPLNAWSTKSMLRMQQIAPEVTAIQEKYKKDPKKAQLEIMNLYRDRGVNPVSGCFPLLIQMPFLIGMFDLLKSTFALRGASFIPGWIDNLTAPDVLFSWNTPIFFIGNQFHLLPILTGIVMWIQQRMMSTLPKDPALLTEQQRQQKFMGNMMAVLFAIMFYNFPSGLNIYFLSSMLLGILQQMWTARRLKVEKPPETPVKTDGKKRKA